MKKEKILEPKITTPITEHYIDYLREKYEPAKSKSGIEYRSTLSYISFEHAFLGKPEIMEILSSKDGMAEIGFLLLLRMEMSSSKGYGIPLWNRDVTKALNNIAIDTNTPLDIIYQFYNDLIKKEILFKIDSSLGEEILTERTQIYNYELKEYEKLKKREYMREYRNKLKKGQEGDEDDETENSEEEENKELDEILKESENGPTDINSQCVSELFTDEMPQSPNPSESPTGPNDLQAIEDWLDNQEGAF